MKLIDVSHTIRHGMTTYPGLPAPAIGEHLSREASRSKYSGGTEFQIGSITMVANTGTYVDAPFHRYGGGKDLSELPLESLANLEGLIVHWNLSRGRAIGADAFTFPSVRNKAVLIHTGWDVHWGTERYGSGHPFLTKTAAESLARGKAALVGIDSLNIDDTADGSRPAHSTLLQADIPICEHLCNLKAVPDAAFRFFAVPVKVKNFGSFPVRAFVIID